MSLREIYVRERLRQGQVGQVRVEEIPALYFLGEVLALSNRNQEDIREIHRAKLAYPGVRLIQEGIEVCEERPVLRATKVSEPGKPPRSPQRTI